MRETFEQYVARIESYAAGKDPRAILRKTSGALTRRISGVSRRRLTRRPRPGKWSAGEILAHLSEVELLWGARIRHVLSHNGVPIVGMDQDAWAKNGRYREVPPLRALETFRAIRRANLDLVGRIPRKAFSRWGEHSQFGRLTIRRMLTLLAGHDINHSRQIDAILDGSKVRRG